VFSFLHNEFVFEKKKDAPDTTFKKLSDMIKKKEKKESIKEKLQNNSKKFTIKLRSEK